MVCGGKCNEFLGEGRVGDFGEILGKDVEKWGGKWYDVTKRVDEQRRKMCSFATSVGIGLRHKLA